LSAVGAGAAGLRFSVNACPKAGRAETSIKASAPVVPKKLREVITALPV
jgi:hypothetical protein